MPSQKLGASISPTYPMVETDGAGGHRPQVVLYGPDGNPLTGPAAALADGTANPTVPLLGACLMAYDGSDWDRVRLDSSASNLRVGIQESSGGAAVTNFNAFDGRGTVNSLAVSDMGLNFDGSVWNRRRGNLEGTLLASAARVATVNTADQTNYNGSALYLFLDVTANPGGAETLAVSLEAKDPASGKYFPVAAFPAVAAATNASYAYLVAAGAVETLAGAGFDLQGVPLPKTFRARVTHSAAGSWTYSLGYSLIV